MFFIQILREDGTFGSSYGPWEDWNTAVEKLRKFADETVFDEDIEHGDICLKDGGFATILSLESL